MTVVVRRSFWGFRKRHLVAKRLLYKMASTVTNGSGDKAGLLSSSGGGGEEESNLVGSSFSLVRYNNPVLIDKHSETPSITPPSSAGKRLLYS